MLGLLRGVALAVKKPPANARYIRYMGSIPGWERFSWGGPGNPLQYPCLENAKDRERGLAGYSPCGRTESTQPSTEKYARPASSVGTFWSPWGELWSQSLDGATSMPGGEGKLGGEVGMQGGRKKRWKEEEEAGPRDQADQRTAEVTGAVDGKSQALMSRNMGLGSPLALLESFLLELLPSFWTFSCSALLLSSCFFSTLKEGFLSSLRNPWRVLPACHALLTGHQGEQSVVWVKKNIKIQSLCNQNPHQPSSHSVHILAAPEPSSPASSHWGEITPGWEELPAIPCGNST